MLVPILRMTLASTVVFVLAGCNEPDGSGYKLFAMKEGPVRYSFEYSSRFKIAETRQRADLAYVTLLGATIRQLNDYSSISAGWFVPNKWIPDAESAQKDLLATVSGNMGFELLDQSPVTIDNVPAKLIAYKQRNIRPIFNRETKGPVYEILRVVDFDYGGLRWSIDMRSADVSPEAADRDKADFEHLLRTFRILD
ncbi:MAG: hypothetical protein HY673_10835 [Chloroflexi bacterium]|nr:hypothetical protein [Chloroflexota bacterium]